MEEVKLDYNFYMKEAYNQASLAKDLLEVPIGCVIVHNNKIIGKDFNRRNTMKNSLFHAEIGAINQACNALNDWRLEDCTIFVTVEPCPMCAGAILQARIPTLVYGAKNKKAGCCGSILNLLDDDRFNHKVEIIHGVMEQECSAIMVDFFANLRTGKNF